MTATTRDDNISRSRHKHTSPSQTPERIVQSFSAPPPKKNCMYARMCVSFSPRACQHFSSRPPFPSSYVRQRWHARIPTTAVDAQWWPGLRYGDSFFASAVHNRRDDIHRTQKREQQGVTFSRRTTHTHTHTHQDHKHTFSQLSTQHTRSTRICKTCTASQCTST